MNTASNQKLPVIFCVEDNGYAISVPVEVNTPGGNISRLVANFPNFYFAEIDGNDPVVSLRAFQEAAAHCRAGRGPALVHGHCVRLYSHSLSDDDKLYRRAAEREADALCDPIARMRTRLIGEGISGAEMEELERGAGARGCRGCRARPGSASASGEGITRTSIRRISIPTRAAFATEQRADSQRSIGQKAAARGPWPT